MVPKVGEQDIKDDLGANLKSPESDHQLAADLISFHLHGHLDEHLDYPVDVWFLIDVVHELSHLLLND